MSNIDKSAQSNLDTALLAISLDRQAAEPLHAQMASALRRAILDRRPAGARMPPSRILAAELMVSRMTVTTAYDQLLAEGYLQARRGSGTFVADDLPQRPAPPPPLRRAPPKARPIAPLTPGWPDQALFPHRLWARHLERAWRAPAPDLLNRTDPFGWPALRQAIAAHVDAWRGISAHPDQIVITAGAWDALDLLCRCHAQPGLRVAIEDPGWPPLHGHLQSSGAEPIALRIDEDGLDPAQLPADAQAVIVTPSRHYPTGRVMPLPRRLALLDWAERQGGLIIEDDYDSEFRYQGTPLPALAGLDRLCNTAYLGSFSKLLSPALRIGYLILPERLVGPMRAALAIIGTRASLLPQPALAALIESGDFAAHLRRMRRLYAARQALVLKHLRGAEGRLGLSPDPAGMHLCLPLHADFAQRIGDAALVAATGPDDLGLRALSRHARLPDPPQGVLLGYTSAGDEALSAAATRLTELVRAL